MDWNFATLWESVGDALPERDAIVQGDRRRTWREFDDRASRLAQALTEAGIEPGAKVASYLYNGNEYMEGLFATFKMRGVAVNVNYRYLEDELVYLLDNSDAEALFFHSSLGDRVAKVRDRAPLVKLWIEVDDGGEHHEFAARFEDLIAEHEPMPRIERSGEDMYFLYTGGTTGMPKGVMWRFDDLWGVLSEATYTLVGGTAPTRPEDVGRDGGAGRRDARHGASPRVAVDARDGRVHVVPVDLGGWPHRHPRGPPLRPRRALAHRRARADHPDGHRRRRVREADVEGARSRQGSRPAVRHQFTRAVDLEWRHVVGRGEAGPDVVRELPVLRLPRLE